MKYILILLLAVFIVPMFSVIYLSFSGTGGHPMAWYGQILQNKNFLGALSWSLGISFLTMVIGTPICFFVSLAWFNRRQAMLILVLLMTLSLVPPDVISLALTKAAVTTGFYDANVTLLVIGLTLYCLPFSVLMLWARYYFIDKKLLAAAQDMGMNNRSIILRIILPLSLSTFVSCMLVNFLLAFNEFPRTYYLSGSNVLLSEFLGGKLNSGADNSIFAGGSIVLFSSIVIIFIIMIFQYRVQRIRKQTYHRE